MLRPFNQEDGGGTRKGSIRALGRKNKRGVRAALRSSIAPGAPALAQAAWRPLARSLFLTRRIGSARQFFWK